MKTKVRGVSLYLKERMVPFIMYFFLKVYSISNTIRDSIFCNLFFKDSQMIKPILLHNYYKKYILFIHRVLKIRHCYIEPFFSKPKKKEKYLITLLATFWIYPVKSDTL